MKSLVIVTALTAVLAGAACYGPHSVYYVDSAREPGQATFDHDLDTPRVEVQRCAKTGVARIETYSSWFDQLMSYVTYSEADRSVEITCAKER
jgi:hypothetical protein